ncbi:unnamed protein product [Alopecurus aequalis]
MPRVGDPDSSAVFRIAVELGYLSSIIVGRWLDGNIYINGVDYIRTFNYWSEIVRAVGEPFLLWNCIYLVLENINSPYARHWSGGRI